MAKLMWIAGILLAALGVALGLMVFFSLASVVSWGITTETAAIFIVGGLLCLGMGSLIDAIHLSRGAAPVTQPAAAPAPPGAAIPEFGRRAAVVPATVAASEPVSAETRSTIEALEKARQDIEVALGGRPEHEDRLTAEVSAGVETPGEAEPVEVESTPAAEEPAAEEEAPAEEELAAEVAEEEAEAEAPEGQLYVVEERTIRNRPARILSDGTVEAETDEGWMRFENLEHLDEYMEAISPGRT